MSGARILVVEDDLSMQRSIQLILEARGYDVALAGTGEAALEEFARRLPDAVLLDLMLPGIDGLAVCTAIRERSATPLIVVSARGEEATKVRAFDLGADDYLTKPFGAEELLARIRVALRHAVGLPGASFQAGRLSVDFNTRQALLGDAPLGLTPREYDVLKYLITHRDRVLPHAMILREIWGPEYAAETQYIRNVVLALRRKIEADPARPQLILTEPGIGYRFSAESALAGEPADLQGAGAGG